MGAHEVDFHINKNYETCAVARNLKEASSIILTYCKENFSDNAYVIDYAKNILFVQDSNNILHGEDDESISLEEEVDEEDKIGRAHV